MKEAGVDVVASEWDRQTLEKHGVVGSGWDEGDLTERNPTKVVNLTQALVQLFNPTDEFLKMAEGFKDSKPAPLDTDWEHAEE